MSTGNDMSSIECGCGFKVTGNDPAANRLAYENHNCTRWYRDVLGAWGMAFLIVVAVAIVQIVTSVSRS